MIFYLQNNIYFIVENKEDDKLDVGIGAEAAVRKMLMILILKMKLSPSKRHANSKSETNLKKLAKRLKVLEGFKRSEMKPEWMIMDAIPVLPPELRPLVALDGGRFATSV